MEKPSHSMFAGVMLNAVRMLTQILMSWPVVTLKLYLYTLEAHVNTSCLTLFWRFCGYETPVVHYCQGICCHQNSVCIEQMISAFSEFLQAIYTLFIFS